MKRTALVLNLFLIFAMVFAAAGSATAQGNTPRPAPAYLEGLKAEELTADGVNLKLNPGLSGQTGRVDVTVRLSTPTAVDLVIQADGTVVPPAQQRAQLFAVKKQQAAFLTQALALDPTAKALGAVNRVINAVALNFDATKLADLAVLPGVVKINPVVDYEYDMWEVVPYIGAKAVQDMGYTGEGVVAAILDSGIDYTHYDLFGSGNPADFAANDPTVIEPGTFPTAKVIGGYDFVGEVWPNGALAPDPDPLDKVTGAGYPHGTHVSSTMGGRVGVAPDVKFHAVKVCSSVSSSCSGLAMLQGLDYAVDPNGDGKIGDRVDIVNMSIGSPYGQAYEDDTSYATNQLSLVGVLVVASAGNSQDHPYVTGTPGAALGALSVAATYNPVEEAAYMEILSPYTAKYGAIFQDWSAPLTTLIEAPVVYGGSLGNNLGCTPFPAGSLAGKIALVDRGSCAISIKVSNMADGGALVGIIGLVAPGEPTSFAFGGGTPSIPGYNISQADSNAIKAALAGGAEVLARFDPADPKPLVGTVTGYSSRGPSYWLSYLKPDITAPGNSYSANAGTGTGYEFTGGTSFSSPTVAGAAALMMEKFPDLRNHDIKALLVGTADSNVLSFNETLAPVSRIGGGEVRVEAAVNAKALAYGRKVIPTVGIDIASYQPSLSFFFNDVTQSTLLLTKNVVVKNISGAELDLEAMPTFRYADDELNGAVAVTVTPQDNRPIPAGGQKAFRVDVTIDGAKLREWGWNTGSQGGLGDVFSTFEYDGYILFNEVGTDAAVAELSVPWHLIPRQANDIMASASDVTLTGGMGEVDLANNGIGQGYVDSFSLLAESPDDYTPAAMGSNEYLVDLRYFGTQTYEASYCSSGFVWAFAVNLWDRVTHANFPAALEVYLDTDNDGVDDYVVLNWDSAYPSYTDGRNRTWVFNLATGRGNSYFYTNHGSNSANMVMYVCGEQVGLTADSLGVPVGVSVYAWDNYFTGYYTDAITGLMAAPAGERFYGDVATVAPGATETMTVYDLGGVNPDLGVLLFLDGDMGAVRAGAPEGNEALGIMVTP